jgi:hypothetical protein
MTHNKVLTLFNVSIILLSLTKCVIPNDTSPEFRTITYTDQKIQSSEFTGTFTPAIPTIIPTMTNPPTLESNEAIQKVLSLLSNNGNCTLPCIWGITPGINDYSYAKENLYIFSGISRISYFDEEEERGDVSPEFTEGDILIRIGITYFTEGNIVTRLKFFANAFSDTEWGINDSDIFGKRLNYYSLQNLLNNQGAPESVLVRSPGGPGPNKEWEEFRLILLYPNQGILAEYTMDTKLNGENNLGCPKNAQMKLMLYPYNARGLFDNEIDSFVDTLFYGFQSLEKVTDYSITQFYGEFKNSPDNCLSTKREYWPIITP